MRLLFLLLLFPVGAHAVELNVGNKRLTDDQKRYCQYHLTLDQKGFPGPSPKCRALNQGYHDLASVSSGFGAEYQERRDFCRDSLKKLQAFGEEMIQLKTRSEKRVGEDTAHAAGNAKDQGGAFTSLADVHAQHNAGLDSWNKDVMSLRMKYAPVGRAIKQRLKQTQERMKMMRQRFSQVPADCVTEVRKNIASVKLLQRENERLNANYDLTDARGQTQIEKNRAAIAESKVAEAEALAKAKEMNEVSADKSAPKTAAEWAEFDKKNGYDKSTSNVYNDKETAANLKDYFADDPKLSQLVNGSEKDRMALQRALKATNPNLVVDGLIGRRTLDSLTNTLGNTEQKNAFYRALRAQGYDISTETKH